jgi:hypothetical protein
MQEARILRETEDIYSPIGWIHELLMHENPIFTSTQRILFTKLNLLYGNNETGKTTLTNWLAGCFDSTFLNRWEKQRIRVEVTFLNPDLQKIELRVGGDGSLKYGINGATVPFNPIGLRIIKIPQLFSYFNGEDDLLSLASTLCVPPNVVRNLADEINTYPKATVRNLRFECVDESGRSRLRADVHGTARGLAVEQLSAGEGERIVFEFAAAAARVSGRYTPTLLIIDGLGVIDKFFDVFSDHLLDPDNRFQTIMCMARGVLDLDALQWKGWEVVRMSGQAPMIVMTQRLRGDQ